MKIELKLSFSIKRNKEENEDQPEGNNFTNLETATQEGPNELRTGFQRNDEYWED